MQKHFSTIPKLAHLTKGLRYTQRVFQRNPRTAFSLTSAVLLTSAATLFSDAFFGKAQNATEAKPSEQETPKQPSWEDKFEPFTDEKYQQALADKQDVIIFLNPDNWAEHFLLDVEMLIGSLVHNQHQTKGRPLKIFGWQIKNKEQLKEFRDKYKVKLSEHSLFLMKNRFNDDMHVFGLDDWFDNKQSIFTYYKRLTKVRPESFDKFSSSLRAVDSDTRIICAYIPKNSPNYKEAKKQFGKLALSLTASSSGDVTSFAITDPGVAEKFKMDTQGGPKVYMIHKSNKYNGYKKTVELGGVNLQVYPLPFEVNTSLEDAKTKLSVFYRDNFTFMKSDFDELVTPYTLVLQINENKIKKLELNQYLDTFAEVHRELKENKPELFKDIKLVKYKGSIPDKTYRIFIQDNIGRSKDLQLRYYNKKPLTEEKMELLEMKNARSFEYEFPSEGMVTKEAVINFVKDVREGKVKEYFVSQPAPLHHNYSHKVVTKTFKKDVLDVDKNHVMFLCTKHCPGCKFLGKFYEEFALENLKKGETNVQYNRVNTEKNTLQHLQNYPYTPVFLVLKKEDRTKPFQYMAQYGYPEFLKNFIDITCDVKLIPEKVEKNIFEDYQSNRILFEEYEWEKLQ